MSSFGQVPLKEVFEMLDRCAPGHTRTETDHHYCIRFNGQVFPTQRLEFLTVHLGRLNLRLSIVPCVSA